MAFVPKFTVHVYDRPFTKKKGEEFVLAEGKQRLGYLRLSKETPFPPPAPEMDKDEILLMSIEKWKVILKALDDLKVPIADGSADTCACCFYFEKCESCPINVFTYSEEDGEECGQCSGTPYEYYRYAWRSEDIEEMKKYANEEINFLENVRRAIKE